MSSIAALRDTLRQRFPDALPVAYRSASAVRTGVRSLDGILPDGGLPRGRLSVWLPGVGDGALLRAACHATVARGERAAWVEGRPLVGAERWDERVLLLRPPRPDAAWACAEELLRSGGVSLLVLAVPPRERKQAGRGRREDGPRVRLSRAAREGGTALVLLSGDTFMAGLRCGTGVTPAAYRWRPGPDGAPALPTAVHVTARATSMGWSESTEITLPIEDHAHRLSVESRLADRRGASR